MVAQLKAPLGHGLPLLMEPSAPGHQVSNHILGHASGWRREDGALVRCQADDGFGATVQHVIVRYLVHGVSRREIAVELGYSERQIQAWVSGSAARYYAAPVREALANLGIGMGRGGLSQVVNPRARELVAAALALLADVPWLLATDTRPEAVRVRTLARLLSAGREPLGGHP